MRRFVAWSISIYVILSVGTAQGASEPDREPKMITQETICELIDAAAARHRIPIDFFTRLIWQESSFRVSAVSPKGAQGIAQFMPGTARERELADPFDPEQAIPASASFLRELHNRFGNLGLAAAAYNAGPNRVAAWLARRSGLPLETQNYVSSITGRAADEWAALRREAEEPASDDKPLKCIEVAALLAKPRSPQPVTPGAPRAPWAPWGVQVAGNFSQDRALASYATLQRKHASILGNQQPMVIRAASKARGPRPMVHVRVPAQTRQEAEGICSKLRSQGGNCMVLKN